MISGSFTPNSETLQSGFFGMDDLPELSAERNTAEQIRMCYDACRDENWRVQFD